MSLSHTPTPWKWWTSNSFKRLSSEATGKDGDVLSGFSPGYGARNLGVNVSEDDAEFIVLACNNHDALVATVEALLALIDAQILVRNIAHDAELGWSLTALKLVQALKSAQDCIAKAKAQS